MKIRLFVNSENFETYGAEETIFSAGDAGDVMYALVEGEVEITLNGRRIDLLTEGDIFGEMALVDNSPRSGSAVALTDVKVVPIDQKRFEFTVQNNPHFATQVLSIMANRLRRLMNEVSDTL